VRSRALVFSRAVEEFDDSPPAASLILASITTMSAPILVGPRERRRLVAYMIREWRAASARCVRALLREKAVEMQKEEEEETCV
jgi:hypothetical protein